MSLLFREREPRSIESRSEAAVLARLAAQLSDTTNTSAGVHVDEMSALRHDAVWSCITSKAEDVAMLPVDVVRYSDGAHRQVSPAPQIIAAPSVNGDSMDWRYQVMVSWLSWGNAWGLVTATTPDFKYPTRIELQNPASVRVSKIGDRVAYFVGNVEQQLWPIGRLWHRPAYTWPGCVLGLSPIQYHAASIGVGLAAEKFGAEFFPRGGPTWIFTIDGGDPGEVQAKSLKERLMGVMYGNRDPLILPKSVEPKQITVNPGDSQFIEAQRYSVEQICRIFKEDPVDHGGAAGKGSITYGNRRDTDVARYRKGRQFWVVKMQNILTEFLPAPQKVRLKASALLMMSATERHEIYDRRLRNKTMAINEVRALEDETPFDGDEWDEPGIPGGPDGDMTAAEPDAGNTDEGDEED